MTAKMRVELTVTLDVTQPSVQTNTGLRAALKHALDSGRGDVRLERAKWVDEKENSDG